MVETVGIDQNESIYFLRFLRMMGKLTWFEDGALRDVIITNPIDYLAVPASRVACKLKPTGNDHTTHANEPHHKKAAKKMTAEWMCLFTITSKPNQNITIIHRAMAESSEVDRADHNSITSV